MNNMQQLSRKQLIEAHNKFDCKEFKDNIAKILEGTHLQTDEHLVDIEDKYIALLVEKGTPDQKEFISKLGLKLETVHSDEEVKKFIISLFEGCSFGFDVFGRPTLYNKERKWMFFIDVKNGYFWYSYYRVYLVLNEKFGCKELKVNELLTTILKDVFKIQGLTPDKLLYSYREQLKDVFKIQGLTPLNLINMDSDNSK